MADSFSSSSGSSTSNSNPSLLQSPESDWGMQLSGLLSALGNNQYQWAMQQFNNGMGITNDNIAHYMDLAGKGSGLAQDLLTQYEDQFQPIMDTYAQQAASYNSEDRQRFMAGQAESTVAQADTAARNESERQLQSYGINPNSGRSQEVIQSMRTADAAARAGAGTQAVLDTADRGRAMTANLAAMGQNVPGMAVNALQSAYTGVTGAENAITSMLNTGANLTGSAAPLFNAASGAIKMPPVGNTSAAKSAQQAGSVSVQPSQGSGGDKSGNKSQPNPSQGNQGQGSSSKPASASTAPGPINPSMMHVPGAAIQQLPEDPSAGWDDYLKQTGGVIDDALKNPEWNPQPDGPGVKGYADSGTGTDPTDPNNPGRQDPWDPQTYAGSQGSPWWAEGQEGQPWSPIGTDLTQPPADPSNPWSNPVTQTGVNDQNLPADPQSWNANKPDVSQQNPDPWSGVQNPLDQSQQPDQTSRFPEPRQQTDPFGGQDFVQQDQPWGQGNQDNTWDQINEPQDQWNQPNQSQQPDQSFQQDQTSQWDQPDQSQNTGFQDQQDFSQGDQGSGDQSFQDPSQSFQDYSSADEGYAQGGQVRPRQGVLPTTGGPVPRSASPSQGRQTDDISARLNAGEFVMPRDVVAHKGSEFFTNLIKKSRQARLGISGPPPKPTMKPALRMRQPSFVSRGM